MTQQAGIRRRPWQAFTCFATFGFFWGSWAALIPAIKARTDASEGELGIVLLVLVAAALPSMLSSGSIVDRFGDQALAPIAAFFAAAILLPGFARSPFTLGLSVIALGTASGAMDLAMNASVAIEEQRFKKRLMHGAHAIFSAGLVVGSILGGVMRAAGVSPPMILAVVAALLASTAVAIHLSLRGRFEEGRPNLRPEGQAGRLRLSRPLLILGGLCGLAFVLESSMESWSALHLEQTLGAGPGIGGLGPAFFGAAAATGRLGAQGFAARIPDRPLVAVATLVAAAGTIVTAAAPSAGVALAGMFVAGAGISVAAPTIFSITGRIVAEGERARALSTVTAISYLGFLFGPPIVGAIAEAFDLRLAFACVAAIAVVLSILMRYAPGGDVTTPEAGGGGDPR